MPGVVQPDLPTLGPPECIYSMKQEYEISMSHDLVVLFEHPEWQKPLFSALERHQIRFGMFDLKRGAFDPDGNPEAPLYFNQATPGAYVRGNTRAVPFALSLIRSLELGGARVLNGSRAFSLELSKST